MQIVLPLKLATYLTSLSFICLSIFFGFESLNFPAGGELFPLFLFGCIILLSCLLSLESFLKKNETAVGSNKNRLFHLEATVCFYSCHHSRDFYFYFRIFHVFIFIFNRMFNSYRFARCSRNGYNRNSIISTYVCFF